MQHKKRRLYGCRMNTSWKKTNKIECAGEFELNEMHYYIFKFKVSVFGK